MKPSRPSTHKSFMGLAVLITIMPVYAQVSTPCTTSILSSFTPCMNFLTNSTLNGDSPMQDCCGSLRSLTGKGLDCLCLIVTGQVPFQLPINRTLAISLPRACKMSGVPVECKASVAPVPASGPAALGPTSPEDSPLSPSDEPSTPQTDSPTLAPEADAPPLFTPPSPPADSFTPPSPPAGLFPGTKPDLTPSAASRCIITSVVLLQALGYVLFENY